MKHLNPETYIADNLDDLSVRGLALVGAERTLDAWPAACRTGAVRSQGRLVLTDLRIAFLDDTGQLTAFPLGNTECRITSVPARIVLTTWFGSLCLEFNSPAVARVVAERLWHVSVGAQAGRTDFANPSGEVSGQPTRRLMPIT
ncbi:MAG: hypothetical protein Q8L23_10890 [Caulobacter sp.]|nr:hypothetical protein [Caulobacter sp.]